jgi:hypothetical protein
MILLQVDPDDMGDLRVILGNEDRMDHGAVHYVTLLSAAIL